MPDEDRVHIRWLEEEGGTIELRFSDGRTIVKPGEVITGVRHEELATHCPGQVARSWFEEPRFI